MAGMVNDGGQNERAVIVYKHLLGLGYTPTMAAGIVGNLMAESRVNPNGPMGDNGTAFGIAQWHPDRVLALKQYAQEHGGDYTDLITQTNFLDRELKTKYATGYEALKNARSPSEAAGLFALHYERPAGAETGNWQNISAIDRRVSNANLVAGTPNEPMLRMPGTTGTAGGGTQGGINPYSFASGKPMTLPDGSTGPAPTVSTAATALPTLPPRNDALGTTLANLATMPSTPRPTMRAQAPQQVGDPGFAASIAPSFQPSKAAEVLAGLKMPSADPLTGQPLPGAGLYQTPEIGVPDDPNDPRNANKKMRPGLGFLAQV